MSTLTSTSQDWKSKLTSLEIPSLARSLGFGGLLGVLIAYIICLNFPQLIIGAITLKHILAFGSALGICTHRLIDNLIIKSLIKPVYKFVSYYTKLTQLEIQHRKGYIDDVNHKLIKNDLDYEYFLGRMPANSNLLTGNTESN
jgi:hypothetical protein